MAFDTNKFVEAFAQAYGAASGSEQRFKHDIPTPITIGQHLHGQAGIFGVPGIDQDVFATRVKPRGLLQILPAYPTNYTHPIVAYLTGFTDDENAAEKTAPCDDPLAAGDMKSCLQGALFGYIDRKTKTADLAVLGETLNRGEMYDLRLMNDPLLEGALMSMPDVPNDMRLPLASEVLSRWMALGVAFERKLGPLTYTGNPNNNTSGGYAEYHGLETLVGTGKIDIITGTTCPALDSYIYNWNYARLDLGGNLALLVRVFTHIFRFLDDVASRTGLEPVVWVISMRRNLFDEIVDGWPCAYGTYRCTSGVVQDAAITQLVIDGMAQREMSEEMRNGRYLKIDGVNVPVIVDDFIPEDTNTTNANVKSGCFASDIYILPLTVRGGIVSLFWEFFNFSGPNAAISQIQVGRVTQDYWTDGGRWLWTVQRTLRCLEWTALIRPRLRLLTPHLAGRIQNMQYCPIRHYREDEPGSAYFADGGDISRSTNQYDKNDFPAAIT